MGGKRGRSGGGGKAVRANKRARGAGGGPAPAARGGGRGRPVGGRGAGPPAAAEGPAGSRRQAREEARHVHKQETKRTGPKHGGEEAKEATRQRLRAKIIERKLARLGDDAAAAAEKRQLWRELGGVRAESGHSRQAVDAYQQVLKLDAGDAGFARTPLLCLMMDQAMSQEATKLVQSKLFSSLLEDGAPSLGTDGFEASVAAVAGGYTLALLTYLSVRVLKEHRRSPKAAAEAETRLVNRLRAAFRRNPFVAEFVAFAPAFEPHFPHGLALPSASSCRQEELRLREALEYCCGYGQVSVWLDTDDDVRRFVRQVVFDEAEDSQNEGSDKEPFGKLPDAVAGGTDAPLVARWRKARRDALDLWASELGNEAEGEESSGGEGGAEDEGEEEELGEGDESEGSGGSGDGSGDAVANAEERRGMG